ncbi:hypothetical protein REPUB_Repub01dG0076100 [Reevesia pubescens]
MAEFSYEGNAIFHRVFHPETLPETHQPPPRFVQIELTISVDLFFIRHDSMTGPIHRLRHRPFLLPRNSSFGSRPFEKPQILSPTSCSHVYKTQNQHSLHFL